MPRHIVDLTSSPAGRPVPPHLSLSTAKPNAPAGKRLPTNGAPATKRLPSNGTPTLTESEALEAKRKLLIDIVNDCKIDRLRTVLMDLMVKNGQMAVDWVGEALLIEEEAVKPFKEGDDDLGDSDLEISEGSDEESDEESDENDNADDEESEEEKSDQGGTPTTSKPKSSAPTTADASAGAKRMRSRYAHCINCEEEFDTTLNAPGLCVWHEGEMEVDWDGDFWADHDEDCHGPIDNESNREEYPEGFIWTCCDKNGEVEGCKIGRHREEPETVKRLRMAT